MSSTCFFLFEEGPTIVVPSLFHLMRKFLLNYTKLVIEIFELCSRSRLGQYISNLLIDTHILELNGSLLYHIPYIEISIFYMIRFVMEHRILCHLYTTLVVTNNYYGVQLHVKYSRYQLPKPYRFTTSEASCNVLCFSHTERKTGLFLTKP